MGNAILKNEAPRAKARGFLSGILERPQLILALKGEVFRPRKYKSGQSNLETAIAFIMMVLLLGGITKIWLWANTAIVKRQLEYNDTRIDSGQAVDGYTLQWPLAYTPTKLNEDDVILDNR